MKKSYKTYLDKLIDLINVSKLDSRKLEVLEEFGRREDSELQFTIDNKYLSQLTALVNQNYTPHTAEIMIFRQYVKVNGKEFKQKFEIAGDLLAEIDWESDSYSTYTVRGIVIDVKNGVLITENIENHYYPNPADRFKMVQGKQFYGSTIKRVYSLANVNYPTKYEAIQPGCPNNKAKQ
jgi:hypothetical protein